MQRKKLRGSFTVEAAFLFPVIILLTAFFLQTAISLYETVEEASANSKELKKINSVELFLDAVRINELKKESMYED